MPPSHAPASGGISAWIRSLFDPVPAHSLTFLRIFWGVVMAYEVSTFMSHDYAKAYGQLVHPPFMFKYYGFDWIPRFSMESWIIILWIMMACCISFAAGFLYHYTAGLFFLLFSMLYLQDMSFYLNHFYLIICLCLTLAVMPANRHYALDAKLWPKRYPPSQYAPRWTVWLVRIMIAVVYVHAGIAKMNEDWIRGEPLLHWVPGRCNKMPALCSILSMPETAIGMSWMGLLWDTFAPVFLYGTGWVRWLGFAASTFFHLANKLVFNIGVFPWVMLVITMAFFEPDWPVTVAEFAGVLKKSARKKWPKAPAPQRGSLSAGQWFTVLCIFVWAAFQVFFPLRHYAYPGDVTWNEEGHRYSWRMKLRDKAGMTKFFVTSTKEDGTLYTTLAPLEKLLTGRQIRKMAGRPEMIHLTADYIADIVEANTDKRPQVRAVVIASVNHRTPQFMVNATVDLAAIEPWTWPNTWVVELLPLGVSEEHPMVPAGIPTNDSSKNRLFASFGHYTLADALPVFEPHVDEAAWDAALAYKSRLVKQPRAASKSDKAKEPEEQAPAESEAVADTATAKAEAAKSEL